MILVIGEALIDLIGKAEDQGRYTAVVGGANANVALALAVRGESQAFLGRISTDGFGNQIRNHLASHGVNLEHSVVAKEQTTLAVATIDEQGVASYAFYTKETADWGWQPDELPSLDTVKELGVKAIQYGCLGMAIGPGNKVIEAWLREVKGVGGVTLSHDLNIRPALGFDRESELERVLGVNAFSDIIKASDADIEWLYGLEPGADLDEIAHSWAKDTLVLITRGPEGVSIYNSGKRTDVPGVKIDLVDTVGAGDTFMATFLAELNKVDLLGGHEVSEIEEAHIREAARVSTIAAGLVCERTGCKPPTAAEVAAKS